MRLAAVGTLFAGLVAASPVRASEGGHVVPDIRGENGATHRAHKAQLRLPLTVHVAVDRRGVAFERERLDRAVARANEALLPHGIEVYVARVVHMPEGFTTVRHRRDRRKIATYAPPDGTVHLFLVGSLELGGNLRADRSVRGLHWRYRGLLRKWKNREYLIVSSDAPSTTLVHELGHLFGLDHDTSGQNLMCSCRKGPRQLFTRNQGQQMRQGALSFLLRQG